jgi:hypothetical protein
LMVALEAGTRDGKDFFIWIHRNPLKGLNRANKTK